MTGLLVTAVASGAELDRVTLDDEGRLVYSTGAARDLFEGRRRILGDTATDADLVEKLAGWSNGYISVQSADAGKATEPRRG